MPAARVRRSLACLRLDVLRGLGRAAAAGRVEVASAVLRPVARVLGVGLRSPHRYALRVTLPARHLLERHVAPDFRPLPRGEDSEGGGYRDFQQLTDHRSSSWPA